MSFKTSFWLTIVLLLMAILLGASTVPASDSLAQVRAFTRTMEFDYVSWTMQAMGIKLSQFALGTADYLPTQGRPDVVILALDLINQTHQLEAKLNDIYSDPSVADPKSASSDIRQQLSSLKSQMLQVEPLAESILQDQVEVIASENGLAFGGQAVPPVLFHITPPPDALIISPRNVIRQDYDISISPNITVDQMDELENQVDKSLNVSSLVVGIGGIGLYPTMVEETTDINALAEVVSHEWVHNYLTLRPLGISYENSPELRTMNETVASIAGKELGREVVKRFYPEYLPPEAPPVNTTSNQNQPETPPVFDFNAEMRITRVNTDKLLAGGNVEVAETYMELRREYIWANGYHIRKLNQAYFAFYGAYADQPGGAAGVDPVGEAVRLLRTKSPSLEDFIDRIAWMWNFTQLKRAVGN